MSEDGRTSETDRVISFRSCFGDVGVGGGVGAGGAGGGGGGIRPQVYRTPSEALSAGHALIHALTVYTHLERVCTWPLLFLCI